MYELFTILIKIACFDLTNEIQYEANKIIIFNSIMEWAN